MSFLFFAISCTAEVTDKINAQQEDTATAPFENELVTVFAADDVSPSTIDLTLEWLERAQELWYAEDTFGWENDLYSPVYLVIVGEDMQATVDLEQRYCEHLEENHTDSINLTPCNYPNLLGGHCARDWPCN